MKYLVLIFLVYSCVTDHNSASNNRTQLEPDSILQIIPEISFYRDLNYPATGFDNISAVFTSGFDTLTNFQILINDSLITEFSCSTNYSIGHCMVKDKDSDHIGGFEMKLNSFHSDDVLSIYANNEVIELLLNDTIKNYNRLNIGKFEDIWHLYFLNSAEIIILE